MPSEPTLLDTPVVRVGAVLVIGLAVVFQLFSRHRTPSVSPFEALHSTQSALSHESPYAARLDAGTPSIDDLAVRTTLPVLARTASGTAPGDRRLSTLPATSVAASFSWAQLVGGDDDAHAANTVVRPPARFAHVAASVPTRFGSALVPGNLLIFGGGGNGARTDAWVWRHTVKDATGTVVPVAADSLGKRSCTGSCATWESYAAVDGATGTPVAVCFQDSEPAEGSALVTTQSTNPVERAKANNCSVSNLGRFQSAAAMFFNADSSDVEGTARLVAFSGRSNTAYNADIVELVHGSKQWFTAAENGTWTAFPSSETTSPAFPGARAGAATATISSSSVDDAVFARGTSEWSEVTGVTPTAADKTHLEAVIANLAVGDTKTLASSIRELPLTGLTYTATPVLWTRASVSTFRARVVKTTSSVSSVRSVDDQRTGSLATQSRLQNTTLAVEIVYVATTAGNTVFQVDSVIYRLFNVTVDAVHSSTPAASSPTSMLMMGGWDGSGVLADLWRLDAARQPVAHRWSPDNLLKLTVDSRPAPSFTPENSSVVTSAWPSVPTGYAWTRLSPRGNAPAPRMGHSLTVVGVPGGVGSNRLVAVLFGGRGAAADLSDTWMLSLEPWNEAGDAPRPGVQRIRCTHPAATALQLSHAGTSTTVALTGASSLADVKTAVQTLFGTRAGSVTVRTRVATAGPDSVPGLASFYTSTLCDQAASSLAAAVEIEVVIEHPRTGGGGTAFEALSLSGGAAAAQQLTVANTSVPATYGEYEWTKLNETTAGPSARAYHAAVSISDPENTGRTGALLHGGLTNVGLLRDAWFFSPGPSPASGTWRRVELNANGAHWVSCTQSFIQWLFGGGFSCSDVASSVLPARYGHVMTKVAESLGTAGSAVQTEAVLMSGGVDERSLARGDNRGVDGGFTGAESPDALLLCFNSAVCGGPIRPA